MRLSLDVAISSCECSAPGCPRTIFPGDVVYFHHEAGDLRTGYTLCAVHATEAIENLRQMVRLRLLAREHKTLTPTDLDEPGTGEVKRCNCDDDPGHAVVVPCDVHGPFPKP